MNKTLLILKVLECLYTVSMTSVYIQGQRRCSGMLLILRHHATRTWNEGSRKSSREKVEAGSRDRQDAVWV